MAHRSSSRPGLAFLVTLGAALLFAGSALDAHSRSYRHRHHHREARARIVVGKPRPVRREIVVLGRPGGVLDLNVRPRATEVWVDGAFRGRASEFDGRPAKLRLSAGEHRVRLVTPDGVTVARDIRVRAGVEIDLGLARMN